MWDIHLYGVRNTTRAKMRLSKTDSTPSTRCVEIHIPAAAKVTFFPTVSTFFDSFFFSGHVNASSHDITTSDFSHSV